MSAGGASEPNRRRLPRIEVDSTVVYIALEKGLHILGNGVGRAVNFSRNGVLLEVSDAIRAPYLLLTVADAQRGNVPILGRVIHCEGNGSGKYQAGIKFLEDEEKKLVFSETITAAGACEPAQAPAEKTP